MFSNETPEEAICRLHQQNFSKTQIRTMTGIRYEKISRVIQFFEIHGTIPSPVLMGRPSVMTNRALTTITALTVENRMRSCNDISRICLIGGVNISPTSVWRARKKLDFNYKPPKIRQFLTPEHISKRLIFAHSMLHHPIEHTKIIFSDESRFCLTSDRGFIWYRKGEYDDQIFSDIPTYTASIMVWGAIGINYKSNLVVCTKNIDLMEYRSIIEQSKMIPDLDQLHGQGNYIFM